MYRDSTNNDEHSMKKEDNCSTRFPESLKSLENEAMDDALLNKCRRVEATITQTSTAIQEPMTKKRKVCKVFPMIFDYKSVSENVESKLDQRVGNERLQEGNVCKVFSIESENKSVSENMQSKLDEILKEENVFPQAYFAKGLVCGTKQGSLGDEDNTDNYSLAPLNTILHNVHQSTSYLHTFDQNSTRGNTLTETDDTYLNDSFCDTVSMEPYDPLEPFAVTDDVPLALRRHQCLISGEPSFETLALHYGRLSSSSDCPRETTAKGRDWCPSSTSSHCQCGTLALSHDPFPQLVKDSNSTECRSAALAPRRDSLPESVDCLCTTLALGHSSIPNFEHCSSESLALAHDSFQSATDFHSEVLELGPGVRDCHSEVLKLGHGSLPGVRDCHSEVLELGHGSLPKTTDCPFKSLTLHRDAVESCSDNQSRIHEEQCKSSNGHQRPSPSVSFSSGSNIFRPVPSNSTGQVIRLDEMEALKRLSNQQNRQPSKRYYDPPVESTQPLKRYYNPPVASNQTLKRYYNSPGESTDSLKRYYNTPVESTDSLKQYYNRPGKPTQPMKRYYDPRGESIIPLKRYLDTPRESTPPLKRYYNPPTEYTQPLKRYYNPPSESIQPLKRYCNLHTKRDASEGCCCLTQNPSYGQMFRTSNDNSVSSFNDKCGNLQNRGVQSLGHFRSLTGWSKQQTDAKKETKRRKRYTFQNRFTSYSAHADYCRMKEDELAVHYLITKYLDKVE